MALKHGKAGVIAPSRLTLFVCAMFLCAPLFALQSSVMHFERLSIDDGLSQSNVKAIIQDEAGFLWFGTENGLNRYDGYNFKQYRRDRAADNTLDSDFITDMSIDAGGNLWIATDGGGVARWNPHLDEFTVMRNDPNNRQTIGDDVVRAVLADGNGHIWIGTRRSGLDRLDTDTGVITHFRHDRNNPATLSHDEVHDLAIDADGMLWVGTQKGLNRLDPGTGKVTRFFHDKNDTQSLSENTVQSLLVDSEGMLWVGTLSSGVNMLNPATGRAQRFSTRSGDRTSLSNNRVEVLFEDSDRRLWVGTADGLNLWNRERGDFTVYRHDPADPFSISDDNIVSLFQDRSGVLWIGTKFHGLSKWNPRSWSFGHINAKASEPGGLNSSQISSFTEDPEGNLWVGTFGGGVNILERSSDTMRYLRHEPGDANSLTDDRVMAQLTDSRGQIWVGTMGGGLNRVDPKTGEIDVYRHDPANSRSLAADAIMTLFEDSRGRIWVGTYGNGVSRIDVDGSSFTNFAPETGNEHSLSGSRATAIAEDQDGTIWVGTDGGGLSYFDVAMGHWERFLHDQNNPQSLSDNTVYSMHVDAHGQMWIGTRAGLNQLISSAEGQSSATFRSITQRDGLANDTIYGIRPDTSGNLWLSTNYGLARYNPAGGKIRNFHRDHGLQGEEFNFGAHYANSRGDLFFGGANGFNAFNPAQLELTSTPPLVALTLFTKLNTPAETDVPYERLESVDLDYSDDVVTFEFAALDFVSAARNRYTYMLEGFDKDWVNAGTERRITYTNLDAGNYVLKVRAENSEGVPSKKGIELRLNVSPPPWQTWWAYLLYVIVASVAIYAFLRSQRQKLAREAEYSRRLEREVADRTRELAERNQDLREANSKLHDVSHTDALTGLRNRRFLFEEITKDIDRVLRRYRDGSETLSPGGNTDLLFLVVDLDHFKPINDNYGHEAGDQMLLQVRDVLLDTCRSTTDVIRWGGDEFLLVARDANRAYAAKLAERIRDKLARRVFDLGNGKVARTTSSIGYACYPFIKEQPELLSWEEVLGVADAAMYEAKQKRNAWVGFDASEWSDSGTALYRAIKADPDKLADDGVIQTFESQEEATESYG